MIGVGGSQRGDLGLCPNVHGRLSPDEALASNEDERKLAEGQLDLGVLEIKDIVKEDGEFLRCEWNIGWNLNGESIGCKRRTACA